MDTVFFDSENLPEATSSNSMMNLKILFRDLVSCVITVRILLGAQLGTHSHFSFFIIFIF